MSTNVDLPSTLASNVVVDRNGEVIEPKTDDDACRHPSHEKRQQASRSLGKSPVSPSHTYFSVSLLRRRRIVSSTRPTLTPWTSRCVAAPDLREKTATS
jgi:hypothetical protein